MQKPNGYDDAEAKSGGADFPTLAAGGYVAKIVTAETKRSKNGNEMLVLAVDIAEGDDKDFYSKLSERLNKPAYPNIYQLTEGDHVSYFKGLIAAVEHSNAGFKFNFDEQKLVGKRLGINLREEDYLNKEGEVKSILKVAYFCSVEDVRAGLQVLPKKTLAGGKPKATAHAASYSPAEQSEDEKNLPF